VIVSRYLIIIEETETGFSAYSPDIAGCVATGRTREEAESAMREAIAFHLDGMREDGLPLPRPTSVATYVDVAA
jgi:predicted RNase H-like HicB family nuclease